MPSCVRRSIRAGRVLPRPRRDERTLLIDDAGFFHGRQVTASYAFVRSQVTLQNLAVAGWTSDDGRYTIDAALTEHPDLLIVAFGMNDAGYAEPTDYARNIRAMVEAMRQASPRTELVLVSSMLPNPEWHYPLMERFAGYRRESADLCGPGVVLADLTMLWADLMTRKSPCDVTGNGINHPNDFGHRLYADAIPSLLVE